jgi:Flp pilus assembly protein TadD
MPGLHRQGGGPELSPLQFTQEPNPMKLNLMQRAAPLLLSAVTALTALTALTVALPVSAADTTPPAEPAADKLAPARAFIAERKWRDAVAALQLVNDTGNADWNNLMGYSLRKGKTPDLAGAERFYNEALRINPKHRGALEYSGELYLMMGDLAKAEARLASLDKACTFGCEELKDLKAAVAQFKANGNRYVAPP